jgi:membrane protein YqaA with SNARE-associated domain
MLSLLQTPASVRRRSVLSLFRHLGALGLFSLAVLDSSPVPTFGGPDILLVLLVASRRNPWYEYVTAATTGSILGAYITFALARKAGSAYLNSKFKRIRVAGALSLFHKWGSGTLVASTAIAFPFPTSVIFAAAGASGYRLDRFLIMVTLSRAFRYSAVALIADRYGRSFARVLRHPTQHWEWLLGFVASVLLFIWAAIVLSRRLTRPVMTHEPQPGKLCV